MTDIDLVRLSNLLRLYRNRQCVLFVGAGFSSGAKRTDPDGISDNLPVASGLAKRMKSELGEEDDDLGSLADLYEDQFGEHGLFKLLTSLFTVSETTPAQRQLIKYKWKEIYTTNYDNVLEHSCSENGVHFSTYTTTMRPTDIDYRNLPIIHINGFVPGATFKTFRKELKLTNTQYYSDDFSRSAWGERFRNDIVTSPCIVFAGYSLYDLDVARVLNTLEGMQERIFFVLRDRPSRANEKKLLSYGSIVTIGVEGLGELIEQIQTEKTSEVEPYLSAWERIQLPQSSKALRDIDVTNFLMSGNADEATFAADIIENRYKLSLNRSITDQISGLISDHRLKNAIITANAGNGKTTSLNSLAYKLTARGITVLRAGPHSSLLLKRNSASTRPS